MFLGEYEYRIDSKGRLAIPPKFRGDFWEGIVLARGFDRCIYAYPPSVWEKLSEQFQGLPITRSKERRKRRVMFATAFSLMPDEQGRILLPTPLREYAAIKDSAVFAGLNDYVEIWSKGNWDEELALMDEQGYQIAEESEDRS